MKKNLLRALLIGLCAGIIDVIPMILQEIRWQATLSAFIHWSVLGLIIPFVNWPIIPCLKGIIIALLSAVPILLIIESSAILPIIITSILLGALIGLAGDKFLKRTFSVFHA